MAFFKCATVLCPRIVQRKFNSNLSVPSGKYPLRIPQDQQRRRVYFRYVNQIPEHQLFIFQQTELTLW